MNNIFGIEYTIDWEEEARATVDLHRLKREMCDKKLEDHIVKLWKALKKSNRIIIKDWQVEEMRFYKRYFKLGYIALSRPQDVTSPEDLLWFESEYPANSVLEIEGRTFKRVGKNDPVWRLCDKATQVLPQSKNDIVTLTK